ncbi:MAG: hypothetical protein A4S12_11850 [Proteobacteria bacterium SG_bin5]|nr:glycosyltransferase [Sphingomonas sp.]OQW39032.1 MAG: hypothetical protein A4S12_11850 [Proteobacteria bacterium SG_bin5]
MTILYITQNGITDHIGQAQVAPYLLGLAARGYRLHVLSAEKPGRAALAADYAARFAAAGIAWTRVPWRQRPALLGPAWTQLALHRAAARIVRAGGIAAVHCRSHPAAIIGQALKRRFGCLYLFDFRDFYADGGLAKGHWSRRPLYRRLKRREAGLVRDAEALVCLTARARAILAEAYLADRPAPEARIAVIPCCTDFALFDPARVPPAAVAAWRARLDIADGRTVLLYLGSIGPDYLLAQMMKLFVELRRRCPDALFLFVANNGEAEVRAAAAAAAIPAEALRFASGERADMPALIALATLSVVFIRADLSKAGCSPTKLAELFAMNVPVVANRGVGDLDAIIDPDRNGSALVEAFTPPALAAALDQVLARRARGDVAIRAGSTAFDLPAGVETYARVYRDMLGLEAVPC